MNEIVRMEPEIMLKAVEADPEVAKFRAERDRLLSQTLFVGVCRNDAELSAQGEFISEMSKLLKDFDVTRKTYTGFLDKQKKRLMTFVAEESQKLESEIERMKGNCAAYLTSERKRQEEQYASQMQIQAEAALSNGQDLPAPPKPTPKGCDTLRVMESITYEVTDETKLGRDFLSVDNAKLRAYCTYLKSQGIDPQTVNLPGVVFRKSLSVGSK